MKCNRIVQKTCVVIGQWGWVLQNNQVTSAVDQNIDIDMADDNNDAAMIWSLRPSMSFQCPKCLEREQC